MGWKPFPKGRPCCVVCGKLEFAFKMATDYTDYFWCRDCYTKILKEIEEDRIQREARDG